MDKPRLAVVGGGKIAEALHIPICAEEGRVKLTHLVEISSQRGSEIARKWRIPHLVADYRELLGEIDAAVIALPHHLHAPAAIELLENGIHVLVEKPMALSVQECDRMHEATLKSGALLAVGLDYRFADFARLTKRMIDSGLLGRVDEVDVRIGGPFVWPVASDTLFRKETAGGGVLIDMGSHIFDLILWWFGDCVDVDYRDDAFGGVEANCEADLRLQSGAKVHVELSRMRQLRNSWIIRGARGELEIEFDFDPVMRLRGFGGNELHLAGRARHGTIEPDRVRNMTKLFFAAQLKDFVDAIISGGKPTVTAREGKRSVELIARCYRLRKPLEQPWLRGGEPQVPEVEWQQVQEMAS